jgi:predicted metal-binding protein
MAATLYVCSTCKADQIVPDGAQPMGAQLRDALLAADCPAGLIVKPVECLSACSQGCAVALQAPGKWGYVYGRMTPADVPDILAGASAYSASLDGIVPWRERPQIFRKQSLARIPPMEP